MSIKFGLLTNPTNNILEEIKLIHKLGFHYVEFGIELPRGSPEVILRNRSKILELIKRFNSPPLAHTAWWIDFGSVYEPVRRGWIEEAKLNIYAAKSLNIDKINFHFFPPNATEFFKMYRMPILKNIIRSLKEVVKYADSKRMTVILENIASKKALVSIKDYKFVIDLVPKLKVHLDIGHAFIENGMKGVRDYIFTFKHNIEHIHIHDNHGEEDEHLPLGKGEINFEQTAKWLKQINYNKTITFEVFTSKEDARDSMIKFKKLTG